MTRTIMFATVIGAMTLFTPVSSAVDPPVALPPLPTPDVSVTASSDVDIVQVGNRRYRQSYRYGNRYPSYRYQYDYRPYGYGYRPYRGDYYPRYYGTRRSGYYNYGYGRGSVQVGPVQVWW